MCADTPHPGSELLGSWMRRYGRLVTYEFDLVADSGELRFGENGFERAASFCPSSSQLFG